jgi:hypothetical protein
MADRPLHSDPKGSADDDTGVGQDRGSAPRAPRWVKVSGIIAAAVVLLFVILMLAGGGEHGPGRHMQGLGGPTTTSSVIEPGDADGQASARG